MATKQVIDLNNGASSEIGGDGSIGLDSVLLFQNPDGTTRKITLRDLLGYLGFSVGTENEIDAVIGTQGPPMMAFISNGRKTNHVEGSGTFSEGSGDGTGVLAMYEGNSDAESIADGNNIVT